MTQPLLACDLSPQQDCGPSFVVPRGVKRVGVTYLGKQGVYADKTWSTLGTETVWSHEPTTWLASLAGHTYTHVSAPVVHQLPACGEGFVAADDPDAAYVPIAGEEVDLHGLATTQAQSLHVTMTPTGGQSTVVSSTEHACDFGYWDNPVIHEPTFGVTTWLSVCTPGHFADPVVTVRKNGAGHATVTVDFHFATESVDRSLTIFALAWIDGHGRATPQQVIKEWSGDDPELEDGGPFVVENFETPSNARQVQILVEAASWSPDIACNVVQRGYGAVDCDCKAASAGDPVTLADGNVRLSEVDPLPPLMERALARTYDSGEGDVGFFGRGWTSMFDQVLNYEELSSDASVLHLTTVDNEQVAFGPDGAQIWPQGRSMPDSYRIDEDGNVAYRPAGSNYETSFTGLYVSGIRDITTGRAIHIERQWDEETFDLVGMTATDTWTGQTWTLAIENGTVQSIVSPSGTWTYQYDENGLLTQVDGPAHLWRTYEYTDGLMTVARDAVGHVIEQHSYDTAGRGISSIGPSDEIATIEYDLSTDTPGESMTRVTTAGGGVTETTLRPVGGAYRAVERNGGCSSCGSRDEVAVYDRNGHAIRRQDASGYVTASTFDATHLTATTSFLRPSGCDPASSQTHCRMTSAELADATLTSTSATAETTYQYADPAWPDKATEIAVASVVASGALRRETFTYDSLSGAVLEHAVTGRTAAGEETRTTTTTLYDAVTEGAVFNPGGTFASAWLGLPQPRLRKSVNGPRTDVDDTTTFVYYPNDSAVPSELRGRLAAVRDAAGHITRLESYDDFGNVLRMVDPNGVVTTATADEIGRVITSTLEGVSGCSTTSDPLCATDLTTVRAFDGYGPLHSLLPAGQGVTVYGYDSRGRVESVARGPAENDLREEILTTYDSGSGKKNLERYLASEDSTWVEKRRESYAYDGDGRLSSITHPGGAAIAYAYDADNRVVSIQDENHNSPNTFYAYDPAGRLASVRQTLATAPNGEIETSYSYDVQGNLSGVTDPNGNVTSYAYDDFGEMRTQTSPVTGITTYAYDKAGNVTSTTDANGATTSRTYDALGRLLTAESSRTGLDTETVTYTYDQDLCSAGNGIGRLTTMSDPTGDTTYCYERRGLPVAETKVFSTLYAYDAAGNRSSIVYPAGRTVTYAYDFARRPVSATADTTPVVTSASYLPFGPATEVVYGNGTTKTSAFNARYQPQENSLSGPSGTIADYTYAEDAVGNITEIHDATDAAYDRDFAYDDLNRLVTANSGASLWGTGSYTYDAMGNMTSSQLGSRSLSFFYSGSTPRLQSVVSTGTQTVSVDAAGNETSHGHYSARNLFAGTPRVISQFPQPYADFAYDGRGVRVTDTSAPGVGDPETTRLFVYSPDLHLLVRLEPPMLDLGDPIPETDYIWFGSEPVAQASTDASVPLRYTFTDHLGTPLLQTDPTAAIVWRAEYEPYGAIFSYRTGDMTDPQILRLPGQEETPAGGGELSYNIFRWYRAGWGRYTQADPIGVAGGVNSYSYVEANPTNEFDAFGLLPKSSEYCRRLLRTIENLQKKIDERVGELDEDPLGLPEAALGDDKLPRLSRRGHRRLIDTDKAQLAARKAEYLANCSCDPPSGAPTGDGFGKFFSRTYWERATGLTGAALAAYLVFSELSRLYPPRNLVPVP
ncbi:MAG: RHS repeat protein [Acidobacteria bacterium]|nr:RHS repeat protein [Acidobacteriota bacterium]